MSKVEDELFHTLGMTDPKLADPCYNSDLAMKTIEYDPNGQPNSQRAINEAQLKGYEVVYPADNELQIDIDNEHSYRLLSNQIGIVYKFISSCNFIERPSKSGELWKKHVTLIFPKHFHFTTLERVALQAMLGSDRVRELLSYVQLKAGDLHPTLFLENNAPKQLSAASEPKQLNAGGPRC